MGLLLPMAGIICQANDSEAIDDGASSPENALADYFSNWFSRASAIQAEQPHWITPLVTTTGRVEEKFRYDQMWESLRGGETLTNYGGGGSKGLDLVPFNPVEVTIGLPSWQTVNSKPAKNGWTDESFRIKYRLLAADEENGNYILSAFVGLTVPNGSDNTTSHHFAYSPTIAFGKGFGDFDVQGTLGTSVPDNGGSRVGTGTPILSNTAFQYHLLKYLWAQVETNYTYWPNGNHESLSQLFLTPGLAIGRIPIAGRVGLTVGAGCQIAVTDNPLYHRNIILSARLPF
ncbi:MAG: hypothetical protein WBX14_09110 [Candidatus Udaeobacter sp.]